MRSRRNFQNNNIVILCEGTDTEVDYFQSIKKEVMSDSRFSIIKIVPIRESMIKTPNPKRNNSRRQFNTTIPQWHYYELYEDDEESYDRYKAQPLRYVREAYLFKREEGFVEAWAVFDKDRHPKQEDAFSYAKDADVNIAFSSLCFEEWILCHFERNSHLFEKSVCKTSDGNDRLCGTGLYPNDCHEEVCLGGRLREKDYIPKYSKTEESIYTSYLNPRTLNACINAARTRHLSNDNLIYECNPYTNIDCLVKHLLGIREFYEWKHTGNIIYQKSLIEVSAIEEKVNIKNFGQNTIIFKPDYLYFVDSDLNKLSNSLLNIHTLSVNANLEII